MSKDQKLTEPLYKNLHDVPKFIAAGNSGTVKTKRFQKDIMQADVVDRAGENPVTVTMREMFAEVQSAWLEEVLAACNQGSEPAVLAETKALVVTIPQPPITVLPDGVACRVEWEVGVYKRVL